MKLFKRQKHIEEPDNYEYWKDPRLDDEGTYDYLVEELPSDNNIWSWYRSKCDNCDKERGLHCTYYHYFYCWDGWDSIDYTTCWRCYLKSIVKNNILKIKKNILNHSKKLNICVYLMFYKFCEKNNIAKEHRSDLWKKYYDFWTNKANYKILKGQINND